MLKIISTAWNSETPQVRKTDSRCLEELDADGLAQEDVLMGIGEETCGAVTLEDLNLVAVAAAA